jgi:hypothetical protein
MSSELLNTRLPLISNQRCLTIFEQFELIDKARLTLSLRAPNDDATLEEKNALYDEQKMKILNFVELLHDSLISEHGKVLLCLYQCE